jgi:hypothetical protein
MPAKPATLATQDGQGSCARKAAIWSSICSSLARASS